MSEDDGIVHGYDIEATVWIRIWAYDEDDAKKLIRSYRQWEDWDIMDINKITDTGETEV